MRNAECGVEEIETRYLVSYKETNGNSTIFARLSPAAVRSVSSVPI